MHPFHLALPSYDLDESRRFYGEILELTERRSAFNWVDFDFYGHQLSLHLVQRSVGRHLSSTPSTKIDGDMVPARHFGLVLQQAEWEALHRKLAERGVEFVIKPRIRFAGKEGEQGTFFVRDPSNNCLEFKYFTDTSRGDWY